MKQLLHLYVVLLCFNVYTFEQEKEDERHA